VETLLLDIMESTNEGRAMVQVVSRWPLEAGSGTTQEQSTWDLLRKEWQWDKFFSEYFGFLLSLSSHQWSIFIYHLSAIDNIDSF
jgi:hypothetical protein